LRRFGFGGFFTGAIATRRVALAPFVPPAE
jgi:hypothetical protein